MTLGYHTSGMVLGWKGQRSWLQLGLAATWHGFKLYEWLLVVVFAVLAVCTQVTSFISWREIALAKYLVNVNYCGMLFNCDWTCCSVFDQWWGWRHSFTKQMSMKFCWNWWHQLMRKYLSLYCINVDSRVHAAKLSCYVTNYPGWSNIALCGLRELWFFC